MGIALGAANLWAFINQNEKRSFNQTGGWIDDLARHCVPYSAVRLCDDKKLGMRLEMSAHNH